MQLSVIKPVCVCVCVCVCVWGGGGGGGGFLSTSNNKIPTHVFISSFLHYYRGIAKEEVEEEGLPSCFLLYFTELMPSLLWILL